MSNIALARPDATFEVVVAAQIANSSSKFGYNSSVGERGAGMSGGQRQRMAIARMIIRFVLDEATSALDVDTERRLTANLELYKDTVFFITHRFFSADVILVMDQGALVEKHGTRWSIRFHQQSHNMTTPQKQTKD